ncbi:MAG: hypothetical protein ACREJO_02710 [Phycisphaerales bacterium]
MDGPVWMPVCTGARRTIAATVLAAGVLAGPSFASPNDDSAVNGPVPAPAASPSREPADSSAPSLTGPPAPSLTIAARERERNTLIGPVNASTERTDAPRPPDAATTSFSLTSMVAPLAAVLGLIVIGAAIFKKLAARHGGIAGAIGPGGKAPSGLLEVLGRYPISRGQSLILLRVDRRVLLLSHITGLRGSTGGFSTLCEITDAEDVASILLKVSEAEGHGPTGKFEQFLKSYEGQLPPDLVLPPPPGRTQQRATREGDRLEMWNADSEIKPFGSTVENGDGGSLKARLASLRGRTVGEGAAS